MDVFFVRVFFLNLERVLWRAFSPRRRLRGGAIFYLPLFIACSYGFSVIRLSLGTREGPFLLSFFPPLFPPVPSLWVALGDQGGTPFFLFSPPGSLLDIFRGHGVLVLADFKEQVGVFLLPISRP